MKRLGKLSLIFLTLSLVTCAAAPFPKERIYVVDLNNQVCAEYEIYDFDQIRMRLVAEHGLDDSSPCSGLIGFAPRGFKKVQNWIRDRIKEGK